MLCNYSGVFVIDLDLCKFGSPFRKSTRFLCCHSAFLLPLSRQCDHLTPHQPLVGGANCRRAAQYPEDLCAEWALLLREGLQSKCLPKRIDLFEEMKRNWMLQEEVCLCKSGVEEIVKHSKWTLIESSYVSTFDHINCKEYDALIRAVDVALANGARRFVVVVDSLVVAGCVNRGRSPSKLLNGWCRKLAARCLGFCAQIVVEYIRTERNPADGPSRHAHIDVYSDNIPYWRALQAPSSSNALRLAFDSPLLPRKYMNWRSILQRVLYSGVHAALSERPCIRD
jgi:hypothetical protein